MATALEGKRIAILVEDGFEESELTKPKEALEKAGAETHVVSPAGSTVKAWKHTDWSIKVPVDVSLDDADPDEYDGLLLPGGVMNPDKLRMNDDAVAFIQSFVDEGK